MQNDDKYSQQFLKQQSLYFNNLKHKLRMKMQRQQTNEVESMIQTQIDEGSIEIRLKSSTLQNIKQIAAQIYEKGSMLNNNQNLCLNMKIKRSNSAHLPEKINIEETQMRIVKLKEQTEEIHRKKRQQQKNKELMKLKQQERRLKQEAEEIKQKERLRREKIMKKIRQIENKKEERTEILKNSRIEHLPKFIEMKIKFQNQEENYLNHRQSEYKNIAKEKVEKYKPANIQYQKYNIYEAKLRAISQQNQYETRIKQNNFRLIGKDGSIIHKEMKKRQKMRDFERNVSQKIRINTDVNKKIEVQEHKHKLKHYPKSYRTLEEYEIHKKHERLYNNKYELGNKYMKDGSEYIKNTIEGKGSKRKVKTNPSEGRIESTKGYKNYLKEVKHNLSRKERDQIQEIMKNYNNKSKIFEILENKSSQHAYNVLLKIRKLNLIESYQNKIETQKQIDKEYMQSLKARLACINLTK